MFIFGLPLIANIHRINRTYLSVLLSSQFHFSYGFSPVDWKSPIFIFSISHKSIKLNQFQVYF
jgi:hypothetical protein